METGWTVTKIDGVPIGLSRAVWTSNDGTTWTGTIGADLAPAPAIQCCGMQMSPVYIEDGSYGESDYVLCVACGRTAVRALWQRWPAGLCAGERGRQVHHHAPDVDVVIYRVLRAAWIAFTRSRCWPEPQVATDQWFGPLRPERRGRPRRSGLGLMNWRRSP